MEPIPVQELLKGTLVFLRLTGLLFCLPIFGDMPTPPRLRIFMSLALSFAFYQLVPVTWASNLSTDVLSIGWLIIKELFIGMTIGFVARLAFEAIIMAATLVGFQMGFGMANLFIADANQQMNSFTALHRVIVMTLFFSLNLHFIFFDAIGQCFELIPLGGAISHSGLADMLIKLTSGLFVISLQLAAPMLVALLFTMAALGLAARAVPQLNVFVISFPVSFFIGLLVYIASFPFMPEWIRWHFTNNHSDLLAAVNALKP